MGEFRITGPGRYRCRNGCKVTITHRDENFTDYPWRQSSGFGNGYAETGSWDKWEGQSEKDIVARIDEPQTEMAGLSGFIGLDMTDLGDKLDGDAVYLNEKTDKGALAAWEYTIDLSKVPASAIVKPEPERIEGWLNIYNKPCAYFSDATDPVNANTGSAIYPSKQGADIAASYWLNREGMVRTACLYVSGKEGEGLGDAS